MSLSLYNLVYLFTNAFEVYVVYKSMDIFFTKENMNKKLALFAYIFRYLVTTVVYIFFPYPILSLISSIITIFIITICYKSGKLKKFIATALIYSILVISEMLVASVIGISNFSPFSKSQFGDIFCLIIVELLSLIIIMIFSRFKGLTDNTPISGVFFITSVLVPAISIFFEIQLFMQENISDVIYALSLICVLIMNFLIFYLYDCITKIFNEKIQTEMVKQEMEYYYKQAELIQESSEGIKQVRHDMKNHIIVIEELVKSQNAEKILDYISGLYKKIEYTKVFSTTGIMALDSVLNYKLTQAEEKEINVTSEITIPNNLNINSNDLVTILGNLIDNAVEATSKLDDNKYVKMFIKYNKGTVFIAVKNSFNGKLNISGNEYKTTKDNASIHGIGIKSIETTIKKYNGEMIIKHSNNEFYTKILLIA